MILSYFTLLTIGAEAAHAHHSPLETMADVTNDFGVCVLQMLAAPDANTVFSPYGLVSMALLVYEGATGQAAAELHNALHLPWHRDIVRIGFRDLHRYLRSYFSSDGFLKGLVLSKPNPPLRPRYVEVLKFYGFQPDTAITQPVLTTHVDIGNKEGDNETTTRLPETTTNKMLFTTASTTDAYTTSPSITTVTTLNTETETSEPEKDTTTVPTTINISEKTTNIMTATNKPLTKPEILAMLGPGNDNKMTPAFTTSTPKNTPVTSNKPQETTTKLPETTTNKILFTTASITDATALDTTFSSETTKAASATESIEAQKTSLGLTTEGVQKTTREINMSQHGTKTTLVDNFTQKEIEFSVTTSSVLSTDSLTLMENQTNSTTTEMDVVTLHVQVPTQLESMDMVVNATNKTDDNQSEKSESEVDANGSKNVTTLFPSSEDTTVPEVISIIANELTTNYALNENTIADSITVSTVFVDATALPVDEVVFFTAPPGVDVVPAKDASLLETFIIMTEDNEITTNYYNGANNRSTQGSQALTTPQTHERTTEYLELVKNNTDLPDLLVSLSDLEVINRTNEDDPSNFNTSSWSESMSNETTEEIGTNSTEQTSEEINTGFPTLEPDAIIFPTISEPRLPRSVKGAGTERPVPLGNWVAAGGWRPSSSDQWFWTYAGDKLVPVLTCGAHLPHAYLPDLQAAAVVLPLDDVRYSLLLLLPDNSRGLKQMLYSLQWHSLRGILHSLKPKLVYATVPAFTVVKHINLTPALHKLGVRSVFDAYLANLSDMSAEPHLYVRSIEQVITISVRKFFTNNHWFDAPAEQVDQHFVATHPFAYFVVDEETKVALVAGTIVDPLLRNS